MEAGAPNIDTLRELYRQNLVAKALFDHAARRERGQSETKVDRTLVLLKADGHEFRMTIRCGEQTNLEDFARDPLELLEVKIDVVHWTWVGSPGLLRVFRA